MRVDKKRDTFFYATAPWVFDKPYEKFLIIIIQVLAFMKVWDIIKSMLV